MKRRTLLQALPAAALWPALSAPNSEKSAGKLLFLTDLHASPERDIPQRIQAIADKLKEWRGTPWLAGGDLISGGFWSSAGTMEAHWKLLRPVIDALGAPLMATAGNHDLVGARPQQGQASANPWSEFQEHLGDAASLRVTESMGWKFFSVDSVFPHIEEDPGYEGRVQQNHLDALREELARTDRKQPLLLMTHMPLLTVRFQADKGAALAPPKARVLINNVEVLDLFREHSLKLVLQGHLHVFEQIHWRGIQIVTGGALCGRWWGGAHLGTAAGFCEIELDPEHPKVNYIPLED